MTRVGENTKPDSVWLTPNSTNYESYGVRRVPPFSLDFYVSSVSRLLGGEQLWNVWFWWVDGCIRCLLANRNEATEDHDQRVAVMRDTKITLAS